MAKRQYFVAVPAEHALRRDGAPSIMVTAAGLVHWDLMRQYDMHVDGDYLLISCNLRSKRKLLHQHIRLAYMLPTQTIVR